MTFVQFAQAHGLVMLEARDDGRWHRVPTEDKPRKKNGAYVWSDGKGAVRNWATMPEFALYNARGAEQVDRERMRDLHIAAARQVEERHKQAAALAQDMIRRAKPLTPQPAVRWRFGRPGHDGVAGHPYLISKGFPMQAGLVLDGTLLVPMYDARTGALCGLQTIIEGGEKKFLQGQRAKGTVHRLGRAREQWLCEGYATGLSVLSGLHAIYREASVIVCFSASNMVHVASLGVGTHVFADNDVSKVGEVSAVSTGLPWAMSEQAGDANDLHLQSGIGAVAARIRACLNG